MLVALAVTSAFAESVTARSPQDREDIRACAAWIEARPAHSQERHGEVRALSERTACFDGRITSRSAEALHAWLGLPRPGGRLRRAVVIRSRGGEAEAAIAVTERLQHEDAEVHVVGVCASSCANYFYAGVRRRHVIGAALILFHGGFSGPTRQRLADEAARATAAFAGSEDRIRQMLATFDGYRERQDALYAAVDASPLIVHRVDAIDVSAIPAENCGGASALRREFLFFDRRQMRRLGIAPQSGRPEQDPSRINSRIADTGGDFIACRAPADFFTDAG